MSTFASTIVSPSQGRPRPALEIPARIQDGKSGDGDRADLRFARRRPWDSDLERAVPHTSVDAFDDRPWRQRDEASKRAPGRFVVEPSGVPVETRYRTLAADLEHSMPQDSDLHGLARHAGQVEADPRVVRRLPEREGRSPQRCKRPSG